MSGPACLMIAPCSQPFNAASRRRLRWPSASVDRRCARRFARFRPGRRNGPQPNKETSLQLWSGHFAETERTTTCC